MKHNQYFKNIISTTFQNNSSMENAPDRHDDTHGGAGAGEGCQPRGRLGDAAGSASRSWQCPWELEKFSWTTVVVIVVHESKFCDVAFWVCNHGISLEIANPSTNTSTCYHRCRFLNICCTGKCRQNGWTRWMGKFCFSG